ncbi:MAG: hypothetical protein H3C30_08285 [Candidatus Hydrogenedentes bacterium]|nr:hypothetical protein [Candidatus Hydrogenedentota bacterium]
MSNNGLRSYIAPGAPATRRPCDGTESPLRIEFGFTPRWYHDRLDVDFSERWHTDPLHRARCVEAMRSELRSRFPGLPIGGDFDILPPGNLDGVHGALIISRVFGVGAEYYADNWPAATHDYLTEPQIARLEPPALEDNPFFAGILEQMETIHREFGLVGGYLNWQGVLNNAHRLRGPELFMDLMVNPEMVRHLFAVVTETMIAGMRLVYGKQAATGFHAAHATVSNCLVNMVSPDCYREQILPHDRVLAAAFPSFGIHNCAWNVDPYIADYAGVQPLDYVDMGLESDLLRARELCPDSRRALMYTPMDLANKNLESLRADLLRVHNELGPCDIVMADIETDTPDQRVLDAARFAGEIMAESLI